MLFLLNNNIVSPRKDPRGFGLKLVGRKHVLSQSVIGDFADRTQSLKIVSSAVLIFSQSTPMDPRSSLPILLENNI